MADHGHMLSKVQFPASRDQVVDATHSWMSVPSEASRLGVENVWRKKNPDPVSDLPDPDNL